MKDKRVVFMGTPEFAVPVLKKLIENTNVVLVVTQPDKQSGRHLELTYSPVKKVALDNKIEVFQPTKIKEDYQVIIDKKPDIIITCAYGQIIPKILLDFPKYKAINVHASLLPKLRGGAPIHKAIIDGYEETGITIMYMSEKMDAGDIISQESIKIDIKDNVGTLHDKLSDIGAKLLIDTLPSIFDETNKRIKQNEKDVTFAYNISREEEKIDFNKTSIEVYNQIRGLYPFPTAYATLNNNIIKICESNIIDDISGTVGEITEINKMGIIVKCKDKSILIKRLKPSGKKEMNSIDFANGIGKENLKGKIFNE